jgi:diacylglycerol kinase family enzyme
LTLELPGRAPIAGVHLVFVSNVDPWTYLGSRPVRTNPGTSVSNGLGVFALTSMSIPVALRATSQILTGRTGRSRRIIRAYDQPWVEVTCSEPVALQTDGDYLGEKPEMRFSSVPKALRLVL